MEYQTLLPIANAVVHICKDTHQGTRFCNHNCLFCIENREINVKPIVPSFAEISKVSDYIRSSLGQNIEIMVAGGEPSLHPDFEKIIQLFYENFSSINLSTNGCGRNDLIYSFIAQSIIKKCTVSLHSHDATKYQQLTKSRSGDFFLVLRFLNEIKSLLGELHINFVIVKQNVSDMACFIEFIAKLFPMATVHFYHYINTGNAYYNKDLFFNVFDFARCFTEAIDVTEKYKLKVLFRDVPFCIDERLQYYSEKISNNIIYSYRNDTGIICKKEKVTTHLLQRCVKCDSAETCGGVISSNYAGK